MSSQLPQQCNTVVVGGGIIGASIAYHLTKRGVDDVVLLERHQLTAGTTWHAAGLVAQLRSTENQTKLAKYSLDLYKTLENETGLATGFRSPGAITVASTEHRWEELRRTAAMARYLNVRAEEISPREIEDRWPLAETSDLLGGIWLPEDSSVGPSDVTVSLARGARNGGARIHEGVAVAELLIDHGRCVGVATEDGRQIAAENVVLACGLWTRHLAAQAGVNVPLMAAEHYYVVTEPIEGVDADAPILRDPDRWSYLKPEAGGALLVGLFEPTCKPWPATGPPPTHRPFITMDPDPEHLATWLDPAFDRIPALHTAGIRLLFDGPESFTPDDNYILGEAPNVSKLFVAAGFNSIGIQSGGGAGMAIAHWITEGGPPFDIHDVDIRRFERFQSAEPYLRARTVETLGLLYAPHWPHRTFTTARGIRRSPLHDRLQSAGASFVDLNGWERPAFFARPDLGIDAGHRYSWGREHWHEANAIEHQAVRERVGLFDLTSFAKLSVSGVDAAAVLDKLSAGNVAGAVGGSVYTQWLNEKGGIEADCTVSRISDQEFWVIGGAGTRMRDLTTLQRAVKGRHATVVDLTSAYACLALMGPESRTVLSSLTDADLSDQGFPFATNREIHIGSAVVLANRMSYVGELGWELYVPTEFAVHVFDLLVAAGADHGLQLCGYYTLNSLRFEKGYRHWGHDITPDDTPIEAGLSFAVAWDKETAFVGRSALEAQRATGATQRLVQVKLEQRDDADAKYLHHNEPLYRNGERVGYVTGGMWGHTVGAAIGMAIAIRGQPVDNAWIEDGSWEVELPGGPVPATVQLRPWL
ncbi:MAG: GcvT family protein [Acidimicrobiales bacterium]|nr:GcvT family protein [Acidimicrobiales bacterium]